MTYKHLKLGRRYKLLYDAYVDDYKSYLQLRGFGDHHDDWYFVKRGLIECWFAPGFHRFWRTWNPGIGYFTHRLYRWLTGKGLGGKPGKNLAILLTFMINGLIHNLVAMIILRHYSFPLPFTFFVLGVFSATSSALEDKLYFMRWPIIFHLVVNASLIIISFDIGFRIDDLLKGILFRS